MNTQARVSLCAVLFVTIAASASCNWEVVAPKVTEQNLGQGNHNSVPSADDGSLCELGGIGGVPTCGQPFAASVHPGCKRATGQGCPPVPVDDHQCTCASVRVQTCWQVDAGAPSEVCVHEGATCDCGDGRGSIYVCSCEGGGDLCECFEASLTESP
jgi:hypothetical protein